MYNNLKKDYSHNRSKRKPRPMNAQEKDFAAWVAKKGCVICRAPANVHHDPLKSQGGTHKDLVGLCRFHHQDNRLGRHSMSRDKFNKIYGIDILKIARDNWNKFNQ